MPVGARKVGAKAARSEAERLAASRAVRSRVTENVGRSRAVRQARSYAANRNFIRGKVRPIATSAVMPRGGKFKEMTNKMLAKKGRIAAGAVVGAGGAAFLTRRRSGLDRVQGRPTGPYVY